MLDYWVFGIEADNCEYIESEGDFSLRSEDSNANFLFRYYHKRAGYKFLAKEVSIPYNVLQRLVNEWKEEIVRKRAEKYQKKKEKNLETLE